jgi:hypothetical protein
MLARTCHLTLDVGVGEDRIFEAKVKLLDLLGPLSRELQPAADQLAGLARDRRRGDGDVLGFDTDAGAVRPHRLQRPVETKTDRPQHPADEDARNRDGSGQMPQKRRRDERAASAGEPGSLPEAQGR